MKNRKARELLAGRTKVYLPLLLIGLITGTLVNPFIHEAGHYSAAYIFNRSAIKEFHYSPENALKGLFNMAEGPYPQYVSYTGSVYNVFTPLQAFIVAIAGVAYTTALFFFLVFLTKRLERRYLKKNSKSDFALLSFMVGYFCSFTYIHFAWIGDGAMAMRIFTDNTLIMAIVITIISLALVVYTVKVIIELLNVLYPELGPKYSPILRKLRLIE
jgi:hypothetical protein